MRPIITISPVGGASAMKIIHANRETSVLPARMLPSQMLTEAVQPRMLRSCLPENGDWTNASRDTAHPRGSVRM